MVKLETPLSELMVRQHGSGPLGDGLEFVVTAAHHRYGRIILTAGQQRIGDAIFPPIVSSHMPSHGIQAHERAVQEHAAKRKANLVSGVKLQTLLLLCRVYVVGCCADHFAEVSVGDAKLLLIVTDDVRLRAAFFGDRPNPVLAVIGELHPISHPQLARINAHRALT